MTAEVVDGVVCFGCGAVAMVYLPCLASPLSALLLRIGWRRGRERLRCDMAVAATCPVMRYLLDVGRAGDEMMR